MMLQSGDTIDVIKCLRTNDPIARGEFGLGVGNLQLNVLVIV